MQTWAGPTHDGQPGTHQWYSKQQPLGKAKSHRHSDLPLFQSETHGRGLVHRMCSQAWHERGWAGHGFVPQHWTAGPETLFQQVTSQLFWLGPEDSHGRDHTPMCNQDKLVKQTTTSR